MKNAYQFDPEQIKKLMATKKPPIIQSDIAAALDVTPATVNRWLMGHRKPRRRDIKAIEALLR